MLSSSLLASLVTITVWLVAPARAGADEFVTAYDAGDHARWALESDANRAEQARWPDHLSPDDLQASGVRRLVGGSLLTTLGGLMLAGSLLLSFSDDDCEPGQGPCLGGISTGFGMIGVLASLGPLVPGIILLASGGSRLSEAGRRRALTATVVVTGPTAAGLRLQY